MDKICRKFDMTKEEVYRLANHLFEASKLMEKVDDNISKNLLELSSVILDMINDDKFVKEDFEEIDSIVKEITCE